MIDGKGKENRAQSKRRKNRKYGQSAFKYSRSGAYSCIFAASALLILLIVIAIAYVSRGKAAGIVGGLGVLAVVSAILGIRTGIRGLRERERNYLNCKIGIAASSLELLVLGIIFIAGIL